MRISSQPRNAANSAVPKAQPAAVREQLDLDHAIALSLAVPGLDRKALGAQPSAAQVAPQAPAERCACSFCLPKVNTFFGLQPLPQGLQGAAKRGYVLAFAAADPKLSFLQKHAIAMDAVFAHSLAVPGLDEAHIAPTPLQAYLRATEPTLA